LLIEIYVNVMIAKIKFVTFGSITIARCRNETKAILKG